MYRHSILFILAIFIAVITSISSCCPKYDCAIPAGINITFHGFSLADVDTIYTTGYAAGTGFTQITREEKADTVEVSYADTVFYLRDRTGFYLQPTHEWKIYIPSIGRTLYVSDYMYRNINCNKCMFRKSTPDIRALHSCIFNGQRQDAENLRVDK